MSQETDNAELLALTTDIVASHVANNSVNVADLPQLIQQVYGALSELGNPSQAPAAKPKPAVNIKRSVTPDYIVCLEDGVKLKMLKRHLNTAHGLNVQEYRERWGLPSDYPMTAPNYAAARSAMAKKIGLGTKPRKRGRKKR